MICKKKVDFFDPWVVASLKTKMAGNFKLADQFLGFIFISIELTENWEKNSERVWKMLHFLFFNYSVAQKLWILDQNIGRGRHAKWRFCQFFWPFLLKKCNFEQKFEKMQNRNCYFFSILLPGTYSFLSKNCLKSLNWLNNLGFICLRSRLPWQHSEQICVTK